MTTEPQDHGAGDNGGRRRGIPSEATARPTRDPAGSAGILDAFRLFASHTWLHDVARHEFTGTPAEFGVEDPCDDHPGACPVVVLHCHGCQVAAAFHGGRQIVAFITVAKETPA